MPQEGGLRNSNSQAWQGPQASLAALVDLPARVTAPLSPCSAIMHLSEGQCSLWLAATLEVFSDSKDYGELPCSAWAPAKAVNTASHELPTMAPALVSWQQPAASPPLTQRTGSCAKLHAFIEACVAAWRAACKAHLPALPCGTPLLWCRAAQQGPAGFATAGQQVSLTRPRCSRTGGSQPLLRRQSAALWGRRCRCGTSGQHPPMRFPFQAVQYGASRAAAVSALCCGAKRATAPRSFSVSVLHTRGAFVRLQGPLLASAPGNNRRPDNFKEVPAGQLLYQEAKLKSLRVLAPIPAILVNSLAPKAFRLYGTLMQVHVRSFSCNLLSQLFLRACCTLGPGRAGWLAVP